MQRRRIRKLAVLGTALLLPGVVAAAPAPTSSLTDATSAVTAQDGSGGTQTTSSQAEATALEVPGVITVGKTSGDSSGDGDSSATALALGGQTVSGAEQSGSGEQSGELGGTGETPLGELSVAPYDTKVDDDGSTSSSASLAKATLIDENTLTVNVLGSDTSTSPDGAHAHSDGARVTAGGDALDLHVLHAEADSNGDSDSAVAVINGNGVITDEQTGGVFCPLDISPLIVTNIVCASAQDSGGAVGDVLDGSALADNLQFTGVKSEAAPPAEETGGNEGGDNGGNNGGNEGGNNGGADNGGGNEGGVEGSHAPLPAPAPDEGTLPFTGSPILALFAGALASIGSGEALRRRGTRTN
jgi:hypothetical protein